MKSARAILFACAAAGATSSAMAAPPDLSGMWNFRYSEWARGKVVAPTPKLTAAAIDLSKRQEAAQQAGHTRSVGHMECLPPGFPGMMLYRTPIQILSGIGRLEITAESAVEPRTIYLNKPLPNPIDPSWNGHSVGHWEGDTLVVETVGMNGRTSGLWNVGRPLPPSTADAHYLERFHLEPGGKVLDVTFTVTDPKFYAEPYSITVHFDRMPDDTERMEAVCEVDLEALRHVDLRAVAPFDSEAARMLNPATRYNPTENDLGH